MIRHQRGRIRLLDDERLEAMACEDYWHILDSYARLLGNYALDALAGGHQHRDRREQPAARE